MRCGTISRWFRRSCRDVSVFTWKEGDWMIRSKMPLRFRRKTKSKGPIRWLTVPIFRCNGVGVTTRLGWITVTNWKGWSCGTCLFVMLRLRFYICHQGIHPSCTTVGGCRTWQLSCKHSSRGRRCLEMVIFNRGGITSLSSPFMPLSQFEGQGRE